MFTIVLAVEFAVPHGVSATSSSPPLGLDGYGLQNCGGADPQYWLVSLTTANQNDILVTWISLSAWYYIVSVTDNNGLMWTNRREVNVYPTVGYEYFAKWTGSGFENITVQFNTPTSQCSIVAFGIAGANFDSPFDPNPSLPSTGTGSPDYSCAGCYTSPSAVVNTDNTNDILLGLVTNNVLPSYNPEKGFACIAGTCNGTGTAAVVAEYQVVTSQETNYPVSVTTYGGYTGLVADAVQGPTNGPSFNISFSECPPDCSTSLTVQAGKSASRNVTVRSVNGFSGTVALSAFATPIHYPYSYTTSYIGVTLQSASIYLFPGGMATTSLTVTTSESTPSNSNDQSLGATYAVTVTGSSRSQISSSLPLKVTPPPGFSIVPGIPNLYPFSTIWGSVIVQKGQTSNITLTLTSNYGFSGQVNLSISLAYPNPSDAENSPVLSVADPVLDLTPGGTATTTLTIETDSSTSIADYLLTVYGSSGSKSNTTRFSLTIRAPELDGVGTVPSGQNYYTCNCQSQLLTTTQAGDAVIVLVECPYYSQDCSDSIVTDSSGLTFSHRFSSPSMEEYYAIAFQPLESDNITATPGAGACCKWEMQVFAIAGVDDQNLFDTDPSIPTTESCSAQSCSVSITTTRTDFIIAATATNDGDPCSTSSGFAEVGNGGASGDTDYKIAEGSQQVTFTCGGCCPENFLLDAVALDARIQQTTVFDGLSLDLSGGLSSNTATRTLSGTISATVTDNATGQTVSSRAVKVSLSYGPSQIARFVLSISTSRYWLAATCTVNLTRDQASCLVSRTPDVNHDGTINISDVAQIALAYGSAQGSAKYSPALDLNGDGKISIFDIGIVALDYQTPVFS